MVISSYKTLLLLNRKLKSGEEEREAGGSDLNRAEEKDRPKNEYQLVEVSFIHKFIHSAHKHLLLQFGGIDL